MIKWNVNIDLARAFGAMICMYLIFFSHDWYDRYIGMAGLIYLLK